eukprot:CAMPEP_0181293682 /NCGR_PEP_ID=MMETSP1101-20121128/3193_1 /TAXON_ID=46948 /ORGANISM="Rhodomonas abbreviata, Strain Caron Lab Isolate" /LENGTH=359 /DNA_ID=CAMNT_0023398281 /DNA_START=196 /DNA_END=1272 /DNA_ORIENTATION=+
MGTNAAKPGDAKNNNNNGFIDVSKLPHTIDARYKMGDQLGEGYSVVKAATSVVDGRKVAVKIITRADLSESDDESLKQEVAFWDNITRLVDFFEDDKFYYVVLEYLDGGELFDRIVKKTYYNESEARDLVFTVLKAIKFCHDQHIVHRDLKPENLLLASKNDDSDIKIADFGFATWAEGFTITSQCGTPGYIAPEILKSKPYGKPADMWSFGVILYILLGGYPPFHDDNQRTLFRKICKGDYTFHPDYWSGVSNDAKELIRGLLTVDHNKRLTVEQAIAHPWLGKTPEELAKFSLESNLATLRKFQATRKLRAAVHTVIAANRMKNLLDAIRGAADVINAEDDDEAAKLASTRPASASA